MPGKMADQLADFIDLFSSSSRIAATWTPTRKAILTTSTDRWTSSRYVREQLTAAAARRPEHDPTIRVVSASGYFCEPSPNCLNWGVSKRM